MPASRAGVRRAVSHHAGSLKSEATWSLSQTQTFQFRGPESQATCPRKQCRSTRSTGPCRYPRGRPGRPPKAPACSPPGPGRPTAAAPGRPKRASSSAAAARRRRPTDCGGTRTSGRRASRRPRPRKRQAATAREKRLTSRAVMHGLIDYSRGLCEGAVRRGRSRRTWDS